MVVSADASSTSRCRSPPSTATLVNILEASVGEIHGTFHHGSGGTRNAKLPGLGHGGAAEVIAGIVIVGNNIYILNIVAVVVVVVVV